MTFVVIAAEQEIADRLAEARRRLAALDAFRATRLLVQPVADNRPAAQRAVGRALRRALDVLDRPACGDVQREEVTRRT